MTFFGVEYLNCCTIASKRGLGGWVCMLNAQLLSFLPWHKKYDDYSKSSLLPLLSSFIVFTCTRIAGLPSHIPSSTASQAPSLTQNKDPDILQNVEHVKIKNL
jgi:hypothetical protein